VEQGPEWPARIAAQVGRQVARVRADKELTAQAVADRCTELGVPLDRATVSKLERGLRQTLTLGELIVLAEALEVPAIELIFPLDHETFEWLPGKHANTWHALKRFTGEGRALPVPVLDESLRDTDLFRMYDHYEREILAAQLTVDAARRMANEAAADADKRDERLREAEAYDIRLRQAEAALSALRMVMRSHHLTLPELRVDWPAMARIADQEQRDAAERSGGRQ
jgi:transcriptional regulator with XRE-family HTH domain